MIMTPELEKTPPEHNPRIAGQESKRFLELPNSRPWPLCSSCPAADGVRGRRLLDHVAVQDVAATNDIICGRVHLEDYQTVVHLVHILPCKEQDVARSNLEPVGHAADQFIIGVWPLKNADAAVEENADSRHGVR